MSLTACNQTQSSPNATIGPKASAEELEILKTAYFASGCFWCVEAVFESVKGVKEAVSGYSGGAEPNPTYSAVSKGRTTHAEAVEVYYDPEAVTFEELLIVFFASQDPTTPNRQGPDAGPHYRSIAFYQNPEEKAAIEDTIKVLNETTFKGGIVTEVKAFDIFYRAEEYHQDYEARNPDSQYVQKVSIPRLNHFKAKHPELLKANQE